MNLWVANRSTPRHEVSRRDRRCSSITCSGATLRPLAGHGSATTRPCTPTTARRRRIRLTPGPACWSAARTVRRARRTARPRRVRLAGHAECAQPERDRRQLERSAGLRRRGDGPAAGELAVTTPVASQSSRVSRARRASAHASKGATATRGRAGDDGPAPLSKGNNRAIREVNRSIILDLVRRDRRISRTELARRSKLTKPTVSTIVDEADRRRRRARGWLRRVGGGRRTSGALARLQRGFGGVPRGALRRRTPSRSRSPTRAGRSSSRVAGLRSTTRPRVRSRRCAR